MIPREDPPRPMNDHDPPSAVGAPIRIGISACLLGQKVRYDGGHKKNEFITRVLSPLVEFVAVCPELELGLGVPREPIRLERTGKEVRLMTVKTGRDLTDDMRRYAEKKSADLGPRDLCGFILKKDSPSCGMERVKVHSPQGASDKSGRGLFARILMENHPLLPLEEEGRLQDARLRENFLERVFAYRRMKDLFGGPWRMNALVAFHTREKFLLLAHGAKDYQALGRLVAGAKSRPRAAAGEYQTLFMAALKKIATPGRHANVLQHMAGFLSPHLDGPEREELAGAIEDFRRELTPLVVPVTLLRHHVRKHRVAYLEGQTYLQPHPKELLLRNHV
jgi:uncharacterized protein YbbK (DUF523 family)/uncharacterized protein YbgA (DUF1722 family)